MKTRSKVMVLGFMFLSSQIFAEEAPLTTGIFPAGILGGRGEAKQREQSRKDLLQIQQEREREELNFIIQTANAQIQIYKEMIQKQKIDIESIKSKYRKGLVTNGLAKEEDFDKDDFFLGFLNSPDERQFHIDQATEDYLATQGLIFNKANVAKLSESERAEIIKRANKSAEVAIYNRDIPSYGPMMSELELLVVRSAQISAYMPVNLEDEETITKDLNKKPASDPRTHIGEKTE